GGVLTAARLRGAARRAAGGLLGVLSRPLVSWPVPWAPGAANGPRRRLRGPSRGWLAQDQDRGACGRPGVVHAVAHDDLGALAPHGDESGYRAGDDPQVLRARDDQIARDEVRNREPGRRVLGGGNAHRNLLTLPGRSRRLSPANHTNCGLRKSRCLRPSVGSLAASWLAGRPRAPQTHERAPGPPFRVVPGPSGSGSDLPDDRELVGGLAGVPVLGEVVQDPVLHDSLVLPPTDLGDDLGLVGEVHALGGSLVPVSGRFALRDLLGLGLGVCGLLSGDDVGHLGGGDDPGGLGQLALGGLALRGLLGSTSGLALRLGLGLLGRLGDASRAHVAELVPVGVTLGAGADGDPAVVPADVVLGAGVADQEGLQLGVVTRGELALGGRVAAGGEDLVVTV